MSRFIVVMAAILLGAVISAKADAETRRALLVGVQNYAEEVGPLDNPHKDVDLMKQTLEAVGFDVEVIKDAPDAPVDRVGLLTAVRNHANAVAADPDAISFFYYSGHGASNADDGENYLVPSSVADASDAGMWDISVKIEDIESRLLSAAQNAAHFVVIDACRNELKLKPSSRSLSKGFRIQENDERGLLLAFSTSEGAVASDGEADEDAGPYAMTLADEIRRGGRRHSAIFEDVRIRMQNEHAQTPWADNKINGLIYLNGRDGSVTELPAFEDTDDGEGGVTPVAETTEEDSGPISKRKALVISNTDYADPFDDLPTAHESGDEFAATLQGGEFTVTRLKDPSRESLIAEFIRLYEGFEGDAFEKVAVVHYIGHARAADEDGPNYLIPANSPIRSALDLQIHGLDIAALLDRTNRPDDVDTFMFVEGCGDAAIAGMTMTGCAEEAPRDNVSLTLADLTSEEELAEETPDGEEPEQKSYTAVLGGEIIKGGSISEAVKRANDKRYEVKGVEQIAVTGDFSKEYSVPTRDKATIDAIKSAPQRTLDLPPELMRQQIYLDADACFNSIQNKVAWSANGASKRWAEQNVNNLCEGAETSTAPGECFQAFMEHGRRSDAPWSAHWGIGVALCAGAADKGAIDRRLACLRRAGTKTVNAAKACAAR